MKEKQAITEKILKNDQEQSGLSWGIRTLSLERPSLKAQNEKEEIRGKSSQLLFSRSLSFQLPDVKWSFSTNKVKSPTSISIPRSAGKGYQFSFSFPKFTVAEIPKAVRVQRMEQTVSVIQNEQPQATSDKCQSQLEKPDTFPSFNYTSVPFSNRPKVAAVDSVQKLSQGSSQDANRWTQNTNDLLPGPEDISVDDNGIEEIATPTSNLSQHSQDLSFDSEKRLQIFSQSPDFSFKYNSKFMFQHGSSQNPPSPLCTKMDRNKSAPSQAILESKNFLFHFGETSSPPPLQPADVSQPFELFSAGETVAEKPTENQEERFFQFGGWESNFKPSSFSAGFNLFN